MAVISLTYYYTYKGANNYKFVGEDFFFLEQIFSNCNWCEMEWIDIYIKHILTKGANNSGDNCICSLTKIKKKVSQSVLPSSFMVLGAVVLQLCAW